MSVNASCRGRVAVRFAAIILGCLVAVPSCAGAPHSRRYSRDKAQAALAKLEKPGLVIGEFTLANRAVIDGDTIRVDGLDSTLRLLCIDTEEIYHHADNQRAAESDFDKYMADKRAASRRPPKTGTPMGVEAAEFAKKYFAGVHRVRLERDHPKEIRGRYGRYLAYVFVEKNGKWENYNIECVRAGMAPYFTKYGYSRRFHDQFVAAEKEARAAKRGIWDPTSKSYQDYDMREAWWNARADFIKKFEQEAVGRDNYIELTNWDAMRRIEQHLDKEVVILATVGDVKIGDRGPTKVLLSRRLFNDFPLIFFDKDVFGSSGIANYKGEFITVRGVVNKYYNKYRKVDVLQIIVSTPGQITGSQVPGIPGTTEEQP